MLEGRERPARDSDSDSEFHWNAQSILGTATINLEERIESHSLGAYQVPTCTGPPISDLAMLGMWADPGS